MPVNMTVLYGICYPCNRHGKSGSQRLIYVKDVLFETYAKFEQKELVSKRERVEVVLADYNEQRLECGKKVEDMWQVCNKCLTDKCVKHYAG